MGKKKDKKHKRHGEHHGPEHHATGAGHAFHVPPQVAGIAAMVLGQVNSPAGRKMIAGALHNAADALAGRSTRASGPVPPPPPVPPVPPFAPVAPVPPEPSQAYAPVFETPPVHLSPDAAQAIERVAAEAAKAIESATAHASKAIETAAAAFERWAEKQAKPKPPEA